MAPSLSICCVTGDPGPRVRAILAPLREVAEEVVVAADARVDGETLAHYDSVADRLFRVEFAYLERHLAWLHEVCSCDWVFRVDGDEVVSPGLIARLRDLVEDRDVEQYWFPRRWTFPDAAHWLAEVPWWPDYNCRLVRRDGLLRFGGRIHSSAELVHPARYTELPIYHLACLLSDAESRERKAVEYDRRTPDLRAPGGGPLNEVFYMPERHAHHEPMPAPEEDARAARAVLAAVADDGPMTRREIPVVPREEVDRAWAERQVGSGAYRAAIEPLEPRYEMRAGEHRAMHFRVRNLGDERWPWDPALRPLIRAAYRIYDRAGTPVTADGPRTPFTHWVAPGETTVVPLAVLAPPDPGVYTLEVDIVHDEVRWFGSELRVELVVS